MSSDDDRISSLYHEADKPAPGKSLDDAILTASRDAVAKPARSRGPFAGGWPAFTSIAALIVITVVLIPILKHEQEQDPQKLPRPDRLTDSPTGVSEDIAPGAYLPTEPENKATGMQAPARAPAVPDQGGLLYEQEALPLIQGVGSTADRELAQPMDLKRAKEEASALPVETGRKHSTMEAADSAPFAIHTPEMWEVRITQLIGEGKLEQARDELNRLKQHYPDYSIKPSILEQLTGHYE